jgi:hypothetical protein
MRKIPDALRDIISGNHTLQFGFAHNLFNLTQLARFLQPLVRAKVQKEASVSAICMALSRLNGDLPRAARSSIEKFRFRNLTVHPDLVILTLPRTADIHRQIQSLYSKLARRDGHFSVTEAIHQITVIIDAAVLDTALGVLGSRPLVKPIRASSVCASFDQKYLSTPGFLYVILQQLALQGINILELSSTATELVLYLNPNDVTLAFDTLYERFMRNRAD